jgi:hypothetical protein
MGERKEFYSYVIFIVETVVIRNESSPLLSLGGCVYIIESNVI